jgi:hypothetical protein
MSEPASPEPAPKRRAGFTPEAKAIFAAALREGARAEDAAAAADVSVSGSYGARRRDPAFEEACRDALAAPAAERRRARAYKDRSAGRSPDRLVANNRRAVQRRRIQVRFDEAAKEAFLTAFALTCDARAAAAEAGVAESTVYYHRRTDPAFAAIFDEALEQGYVRLEAEALRQRLAAQQRLRAALDSAGEAGDSLSGCPLTPHDGNTGESLPGCPPTPSTPTPPLQIADADIAAEFDRVIKLLSRWDRKPRGPERRAAAGSLRQVWTFDAAIALLDRRLAALAIFVPDLPEAGRYDAAPELWRTPTGDVAPACLPEAPACRPEAPSEAPGEGASDCPRIPGEPGSTPRDPELPPDPAPEESHFRIFPAPPHWR